jgi:hypothetical protein
MGRNPCAHNFSRCAPTLSRDELGPSVMNAPSRLHVTHADPAVERPPCFKNCWRLAGIGNQPQFWRHAPGRNRQGARPMVRRRFPGSGLYLHTLFHGTVQRGIHRSHRRVEAQATNRNQPKFPPLEDPLGEPPPRTRRFLDNPG